MKTDYPLIETWVPGDNDGEGRPMVSSWNRTVFEARQRRARILKCDVTDVCGRRVK